MKLTLSLVLKSHYKVFIFWSFGIIGLIPIQFKNRVPLEPVLGGVGSVAPLHSLNIKRLNKTESAMFVSLMCSFLPEDIHSEFNAAYSDVSNDCPIRVSVTSPFIKK